MNAAFTSQKLFLADLLAQVNEASSLFMPAIIPAVNSKYPSIITFLKMSFFY